MTKEMKKDFTELAELMAKLSIKYQSVYFQTAHCAGEQTSNDVTIKVEKDGFFECIDNKE